MKRTIGFALAAGLALLVAGCANQGGGGTTGGGAGAAPVAAAPEAARNFNLAVKCPGVHWEKTKGWSNQQIMQQESIDESEIAACEQWHAAQPKGYVPPPPPGTPAAAKAGGTSAADGAPSASK